MVCFELFPYKVFHVLIFFILLARTKDFSLVSKLLEIFFFLAAYFFLLYLPSLSDTFSNRSILLKLNSFLSLWLDRDFFTMIFGLIPHFSLLIFFIFFTDYLIIVTVGLFAFCLSDMALCFDILLFSSLIFCSAANVFPPLRLVINILTLNLPFRSFILTYWHSLFLLLSLNRISVKSNFGSSSTWTLGVASVGSCSNKISS